MTTRIHSHALAVSALHTSLNCHPTRTPVSLSARFSLTALALVSITLAPCLQKPLDLFLTSVSKHLTAYCTVFLAQVVFTENRRLTLYLIESSFASCLLCSFYIIHNIQIRAVKTNFLRVSVSTVLSPSSLGHAVVQASLPLLRASTALASLY